MGVKNVKDRCDLLRIFFNILLLIEALSSIFIGYYLIQTNNIIPISVCVSVAIFLLFFVLYSIIMVWIDTAQNIQIIAENVEPTIVHKIVEKNTNDNNDK